MPKFKGWERKDIYINTGFTQAITPIIITASRSTDIPAFYPEWFINRLKEGYVKWINPFNHQPLYVSFENIRLIVFWSKNPAPILQYLHFIDKRGINYYFQYTLNNYDDEGFEPNVPTIKERIETFRKLSLMIGKEKVIWRFDPLVLTDTMDVNRLLDKVKVVGDSIYEFTEKLVISFIDIKKYKTVDNRLSKHHIRCKEFTPELMEEIAKGISKLNERWGLDVSTCAEPVELSQYGIHHNKCVDDILIRRIFHDDNDLINFLDYHSGTMKISEKVNNISHPLKDKGQRKTCGCIVSKDIGQYNTCGHLCLYCYANYSDKGVMRNMERHTPESDSIIPL